MSDQPTGDLDLKPTPTEREIRVFQVNDWAFVAAYTKEDALAWHVREFGEEDIDDDCNECDVTIAMRDGEEPDSPKITMREQIDRDLAAGKQPPFLVAVDGHYC